ncbi:CocE/NonD family hydrolase [Bacillus sp. FJAT-49711]|uniref:CocE/NonD family hydrolase n=1 Tax=Bacillus sp. FJAT-49711 TaxID=2833585 RepID=UPI001BC984ED|nr:CocE/NonD family hydrolase [Bacillus sp. FJAT-49711]MBS4218048.1 CocE/NonD family hydrolase [Bacillus sp. FJAT-49711]
MEKENIKNNDYVQDLIFQLEVIESELETTHSFHSLIETMVEMRDGIKLFTRVYFPSGQGPWPVILERSPYPQQKEFLAVTSKQFTKYGFVVVSQECRGKGDSEGIWTPFENERNDGLDTLQWIIKQEWMNSNIAMYGHSYGGFEQWILADQLPEEVKTLFIGVFGTERYAQMYMNGMFRHEIYTSWAVENSGVSIEGKLGDIYQNALKIRPHIDMDIQLFGEKFQWYREWITNVGKNSNYWEQGIWNLLSKIPKKLKVPLFLVGGWYDHHLDGMVKGYQKLSEDVKNKSKFVIGPWIHTLKPGGDLEYPNSNYNSFKEAIKWFNHHLKKEDYSEPKGVVETYVIRNAQWKDWEGWLKSSHHLKFYLDGGKSYGANKLALTNDSPEPSHLSFQYDPEMPVKTRGGEALLAWISPDFRGYPPSSVLQEPIGKRNDILSFVSEALEKDMIISGSVKVHLSASTDVEDTSFTVKLMEVFQNGEAYNIRDGITSIRYRNGSEKPQGYQPDSIVELEIELWAITWAVKKGSRLRLDISSSNFPAYHIHPNKKGEWAEEGATIIANQKIYVGKGFHSYVEIPITN